MDMLASLDASSLLSALEASPVSIMVFSVHGPALVVQNRASREMIGERALGAPGHEALPEYPEYMLAVERVIETGGTVTFERAPTTIAGAEAGAPDVVLLDAAVSPLFDEKGELAAVICQAVDVTGRGNQDERLRVSMALNRVALELSRSLEVDQVARAVTRMAAEVFSGWGILDLWQPDGSLVRVAATHHDPGMQPFLDLLTRFPRVSGRASNEHEPHSVRAARTGEVVIAELDPEAVVAACTQPEHASLLEILRPKWSMSAPVKVGARHLGALTIVRPVGEAAFRSSDRVVLEHFAERAAIALDHARDYDQQRSAALTLQRSLLPVSSDHVGEGVQIAVRYAAGGAGAEVGGDWYDTVDLGHGCIAVVVGDVEGHDLRAAALMGQIRAVVHSHAHLGLPPGRITEEANEFLLGQHTDQLVTMTYVQMYPDEGLMVMVRAGHMPAVIVGPDGRWRVSRGRGGMALGVQAGVHWLEETLQLEPGALVAVFTDGLVETLRQDFEEGVYALAGLLAEHVDDDLEQLADMVLHSMPGSSDSHDDIALVLVRLDGHPRHSGHRVVRRLPAAPSSAPVARLFLTDVLGHWGARKESVATAALLVTELVSNATRESDTSIELRLELGDGKLRVAVADDSDRMPYLGMTGPDSPSGRGLQLVQAMSDSWGVETQALGKSVWFELPI